MAARFEIKSAPQLRLFEQGEDPATSGPAAPREKPVSFKEANPRDLMLGGRRLDEYLREAGLGHVVVLEKLLAKQDWTEFEKAYRGGGRQPYPPMRMAALILYGTMKGCCSLRDLQRLARVDLGAMYVCGGIAPDYSTLCRFLHLHEELITGPLFESITRDALKRVGARVSEVAIDGTTVQAAASRYRTLSVEAAEELAKKARDKADAAPEKQQPQKAAEQAERAAAVAKEREAERRAKGRKDPKAKVSPTEPEAVIQPLKDKSVAPAYKLSAAVNKQRIIVGQSLHPTSETQVVPELIEQAKRIGNEPVRREMMDAGYFCESVLEHALEHDIDPLVPEGNPQRTGDWTKASEKQFPKSRFVYDEERDCYECPAGQILRPLSREKKYTKYGGADCAECPLRAQCTSGTKGRTIKRYASDELKDAQRQVMSQPAAQRAYRRRQAWVEPIFGQLKHEQGLRRFLRRGLLGARLEAALHATAHNLGRVLAALAQGALNGADALRRLFSRLCLVLCWLTLALPENRLRAPTSPRHLLRSPG